MIRRFFLADAVAYEAGRAAMDAAWSHPRAGTASCLPVADSLPRHTDGRVAVEVWDADMQMPPADQIVAGAIAGGTLRELSSAEYRAINLRWYGLE